MAELAASGYHARMIVPVQSNGIVGSLQRGRQGRPAVPGVSRV